MSSSFFSPEYRKSLFYLGKWAFLALSAGVVGAVTLHGFDMLLDWGSRILFSSRLPLPFFPLLGAVLAGGIVYRFEPSAAGEGIPSYIEGLRYRDGRLSGRQTLFKFWSALATLVTLGNGGVVGPVGRISSGLLSLFGRVLGRFKFDAYDVRTASICGMAAVVGAVFHSSIGGGIFAVEIIQKSEMRYRDLFPAIMSGATAVYVSRALGWQPFYVINANHEVMDLEITWWLLLLAVLVGLFGKGFTTLYGFITKLFRRDTGSRILLKVLIGSALASIIAWSINPHLMGTSNEIVAALLTNDIDLLRGNIGAAIPLVAVIFLLILGKALGNTLTVGSGMSAGFTGPTIMLGMLFGYAAAAALGYQHGSAEFYAFMAAGFSGMLAGTMNTPIAAAVLTIESFGLAYGFPAGIAAVIGFQVNRHHTIYDYSVHEKDEDFGTSPP
ncbi:MAG: chloride channel protein [Spirochaetales bacterium]|nr:chloride channel protein [Spirochaetales bacterium]MCF7937462.1 chloride channel protein [Spirochaetales bacterium]